MKLYKNALIMREQIGTATDDDGSVVTLSVSVARTQPVITLGSGNTVVIDWADLIELAKKFEIEQLSVDNNQEESK